MKYSIDTLLRGIAVVRAKARAKNQDRLDKNVQLLSDYRAAGMLAAHQVVAVLREEIERIERGYGSYKDGVSRDYWRELGQNNPLGSAAPWDTTIRDLEQRVAEGKVLTSDDLPPSELEVLLNHAKSIGETTVSFSFLTRSGHRPAYINEIAVAGAQEEEPSA